MQVSIETLSGLERRMTIGVPAEKIESKVQSRLQEAARTFQMKGFRKGKVPLKVIRNRFGKGVRQEVLGEVMSESYYEAVSQENVKPAGQPRIEAKSLEEGKDLEFTATFEVYPEVRLGDFSKIKVEKKTADISEEDIDKMIETLRQQRLSYKETNRSARKKDQVNIDFEGTLDGEKFEGGEAKGVNLVLGSNRMIPGFEEGLLKKKKGEDVTLSLNFPEDYHSEELAGKPVEFKVHINEVAEPVLPELNDEFFASFDVTEGGLEAFRQEVKANMERELKHAVRNNVKNQVIEGLLEIHQVEVPKALISNEVDVLRRQAVQQFGGGANIDASRLPAEMFSEQATRRVTLGLIMGEIIKEKDIKPEPKAVRALVEDLAESYEQPEEVVKWYYSDKNNLAQVETMALEEAVIDQVLDSAKVQEKLTSYEEALKPTAAPEAKAKAKPKAKAKAEPKAKTTEEAENKRNSSQ